MDKILIPTDGSEASKKAAILANKMAKEFESEIHILCVQEMTGPQGGVTGPRVYMPSDSDTIDEYIGTVRSEISEEVSFVEETKKSTDVSSEIVQYVNTENVDHIIMGTTGKTGASRILVGSVAEKVVRKSPVPVTTIKENFDFEL